MVLEILEKLQKKLHGEKPLIVVRLALLQIIFSFKKTKLIVYLQNFKTTVNKFYNSKKEGLDNAAEYGRIIDDKTLIE